MTVLIFANGEIEELEWIRPFLKSAAAVIAADGGTHHLMRLQHLPDLVIGDMDSLSDKAHKWLEKGNVPLQTHPAVKDETDLELALMAAANQFEDDILLFGVLGGRLDQTLANILLLAHPVLRGRMVQLVTQRERAWLVSSLPPRRSGGRSLRVATKFPKLTAAYLEKHGVAPVRLINAEGTLEIAPSIGYADMIADLVSTGITLRDNHLRPIEDGEFLQSQACLIANRQALRQRSAVLEVARKLLEYIEAHLRAEGSYLVTANVLGDSPQAIAQLMADKPHISGLQGPTISQVISPQLSKESQNWHSVNIVVQKSKLVNAIAELRQIGGSGVIVSPCTYIFEEEPARYKAMLKALQ